MLVKPTQSARAPNAIISLVASANLISTAIPRTVTTVVEVITPSQTEPTPGAILQSDGGWTIPPDHANIAYTLQGGGWVSGIFDGTFTANAGPDMFTWYSGSDDHKLVRIVTATTRVYEDSNGDFHTEVTNSTIGDGVNSFPQTNVDNINDGPGVYTVGNRIEYDSGLVETHEYTYTIPGIVSVPPPPPLPPVVETVAFNALPGGAPQPLVNAAQVIAQASVAFTNTVGAGEAIYASTGDHIQAVITELNAIAAIVLQWEVIANDGTAPQNLRNIAAKNAYWVARNLLDLSHQGHNLQSDPILAIVDANFVKYANYGNYASSQSADTLIDIDVWS